MRVQLRKSAVPALPTALATLTQHARLPAPPYVPQSGRGEKLISLGITLSLLLLSQAAVAQVVFREDSGLTKTEYFLANGKYSAAVDAANDVLTRHPDNADAYTYRGFAYAHLNQPKDAIKDYKRALEIDPQHLGANKYLADAYLQKGDLSRAVEQKDVMHMICGQSDCEELDELQNEIEQYKIGKQAKKD